MVSSSNLPAVITPQDVGEIDRRSYIGSSDVAAIMGLSKWKTPLECYMAKINGEPEVSAGKRALFARGKRWEPIALDMLLDALEDKYGKRPVVLARNQRYRHPEYPFLASEIDAELLLPNGEEVNAELKTVDVRAAKDWGDMTHDEVDDEGNIVDQELTDAFPIYYACQTMFGLAIKPRQRCIVGALFGADYLVPYEIKRDEDTIVAIIEKCVTFWNDHVLREIPPPPIDMGDMMLLYARTNGQMVKLDDETAELLQQLRSIRASLNSFKMDEKDLQFRIAEFVTQQWGTRMGNTLSDEDATMFHNGRKVGTWGAQSRTAIDGKALRKEYPAIAAKFENTSYFRVMRLAKI